MRPYRAWPAEPLALSRTLMSNQPSPLFLKRSLYPLYPYCQKAASSGRDPPHPCRVRRISWCNRCVWWYGCATCELLSGCGGCRSPTRVLQKGGDPAAGSPTATLLRLRPSHRARLRPLPPRRVGTRTSGAPGFHGVTGGVYKARERIHRGIADPRLLAIPASRGRVADRDPNLGRLSGIRSLSRVRSPLYRPL